MSNKALGGCAAATGACSDIHSGTKLYMSLYPKDSTDGGTMRNKRERENQELPTARSTPSFVRSFPIPSQL